MSKPQVKYPGLREAILYNETRKGTPDYLSIDQIAEKFNCKGTYVYRLRYLLGVQSKAAHNPVSFGTIHTSAKTTEEGKLADLLNEPLLTPLDRLKILSKLIRTGSPTIKISAIKAMEELTRTSEGRIGPGAPLSDDDKITRIARILLAVPQPLAAQAWETAYGYPPTTAPTRSALQSEPRETPPATDRIEKLLPNMPIPTNRPSKSSDRPQPPDENGSGAVV